ncbi:MAG: GFA family protein [Hyphomicrobiaceae bacterium]
MFCQASVGSGFFETRPRFSSRFKRPAKTGGGHCHCVDCRKSSGTGHGLHMDMPAAGFAVTGNVRTYDKQADRGTLVSRGFWPTCDSAIYSRDSGIYGLVFVDALRLEARVLLTDDDCLRRSRALVGQNGSGLTWICDDTAFSRHAILVHFARFLQGQLANVQVLCCDVGLRPVASVQARC